MIVRLRDAAVAGRGAVGGKAHALAVLAAQNFDVPYGFVIPAGITPTQEGRRRVAKALGGGPFAVR